MQVGAPDLSRGIEASFELELRAALVARCQRDGVKAEFEDFLETTGSPAVLVSRDGNVPPNVAERLASMWLSWQFAPDWSAAGGVRYVGKRYADNANTLELPGYSTTDLALTWQRHRTRGCPRDCSTCSTRGTTPTAYYTSTQWLLGADRRVEFTVDHRF